MKSQTSLMRKSHFLGTKIRNLRKRNRLTIEDLSSRCFKVDPEASPSVSYLSMIERGKRVPSEATLKAIAEVFQKDVDWFLDGEPELEAITPTRGNRGGLSGMALEPSFLFSNEILQNAIPELLSQTGTEGRQFAHLLIRAHQERHRNHFPDLEKAAESVGGKRMPLSLDDMMKIAKDTGLRIKWFDRLPEEVIDELGIKTRSIVSSYFDAPKTIHANNILKSHPNRLKYDLAVHIGHSILHDRDGKKNVLIAGNRQGDGPQFDENRVRSTTIDSNDILHAWRDFECSFFAGALLCPKVPFRQLLDRYSYDLDVAKVIGVSKSVVMRRMTAVSPYPYWHYFDAYAPGKLKAVYRANGIPLPWGNMRKVEDPCQHWAVFRLTNLGTQPTSAQISILDVKGSPRLYCCWSVRTEDLAKNNHVLCAGIDLNPAMEAQGFDADDLASDLKRACVANGGSAVIPKSIKSELSSVARILNISWVEAGIENEARVICTRGTDCPREPRCYRGDEHRPW